MRYLRLFSVLCILFGFLWIPLESAKAGGDGFEAPTDLTISVSGEQLILNWTAPASDSSTATVERYAIFWYEGNNGYAVSSTTTSISLPLANFSDGITRSFKIRADNDTQHKYSGWSNTVTFLREPPAPPTYQYAVTENSDITITAPEGEVISLITAWYGNPDNYAEGADQSSEYTNEYAGQSSANIFVDNRFGDPVPGTQKVLRFNVEYQNAPTPTYSPTPDSSQSPEPTPSPFASATPSPTPLPEPSSEPTPENTPTPQPSASPLPSPEPSQVPPPSTPEPTPLPSPSPAPPPQPQPAPETSPIPVLEPEPIPSPTPAPNPDGIPEEEQSPEPNPEPSPEPIVEQVTPPPTTQFEPEVVSSPVNPTFVEPPFVASESLEQMLQDGNVSKVEVANLVKDVFADGVMTEAEKKIVVEAILALFENAPAVSLEILLDSGLTLEDLPLETPVDVRQDENGNAVIITAEVAIALELLASPAEILKAIFSSPAQLLFALGNLGADMSPQEREEATKTIIAATIVGNIAATTMAASIGGIGYRRPN